MKLISNLGSLLPVVTRDNAGYGVSCEGWSRTPLLLHGALVRGHFETDQRAKS